jgi:ACS family tartrate transporter-like MFS transporter
MAAAPISVVLGSPISSALLELHGIAGLTGWQWLFILEAVPAIILGVVVLFYMTDRPEKAKWLPDDQRAWLVETMEAERAKKAGHASHSIWRGVADLRVLASLSSILERPLASTRSVSGPPRSSKSSASRTCRSD